MVISLGFCFSSHNFHLFVKSISADCILLSLCVDDMNIIGDDNDSTAMPKHEMLKSLKRKITEVF